MKRIESSDFCGFSCSRGHESWRKLNRLIFVDFHVLGSWKLNKMKTSDFLWKLNCLIFVDFHVPPGKWKLRIIKASEISWNFMYPGSFYLSNYPEIMKIEENWIVWFLRIFMYPGSKNWRKLNRLIFKDFRLHENPQKSYASIFLKIE